MAGGPRNRSAGGKQARGGRAAAGRSGQPREAAAYPIHDLPPPLRLYGTWLEVPGSPDAMAVPLDDALTARLAALGPWYHGLVPMAALVLDDLLAAGTIPLAVPGSLSACDHVTPADAAARLGLPSAPSGDPASEEAAALHAAHASGRLVVRDDETVSAATPPPGEDGEWVVNALPMPPVEPGQAG